MTMWNQTIPDRLRGRLAWIEMVSYTSGPLLGNAEAGAAASLVGLRASVVSGGVLCVAAVAATAAALPTFWAYDARHNPQESGNLQESDMAPSNPGEGTRSLS